MPKAEDVIHAARAYYDKEGNGAGGWLHLVLDDGNVEDEHVDYCIKAATEHNDADGMLLGEVLLTMPVEERQRLYEMLP